MRSWILRVLALGIGAYGVHSLLALNVASKLLMQVAVGFADYQVSSAVYWRSILPWSDSGFVFRTML